MNAAGQAIAAAQPESVRTAITFAFVGLETITGIVLAVLLIFLNVEKGLKEKQEEIRIRKGLAAESEETADNKEEIAVEAETEIKEDNN